MERRPTVRSVVATRFGGPEVLRVVERPQTLPAPGHVRIRVRAASVSRPDVTARRGDGLYSGTPLAKGRPPFVPGYAVVGDVDAIGPQVSGVVPGDRVGVLTVIGGYTESLHWRADRLIDVPRDVDPVAAVTLVLNYLVAYQCLHRRAVVAPGERTVIIGASGGIGTALLQLGRLAGLELYGVASASKHEVVTANGAVAVDRRTEDVVEVLRHADPPGADVVIDGVMDPTVVRRILPQLRPGGRFVGYGEPSSFADLARVLARCARTNLRRDGRRCRLYGTSPYTLGFTRPFVEDWATLFGLLRRGDITPVVAATMPIGEAARANALLERGGVVGNVVLVGPDAAAGDPALADARGRAAGGVTP